LNVEPTFAKATAGMALNFELQEYPISNKEYPMTKERSGSNS